MPHIKCPLLAEFTFNLWVIWQCYLAAICRHYLAYQACPQHPIRVFMDVNGRHMSPNASIDLLKGGVRHKKVEVRGAWCLFKGGSYWSVSLERFMPLYIYASAQSFWAILMMTNKLKTRLSANWILCIPLHITKCFYRPIKGRGAAEKSRSKEFCGVYLKMAPISLFAVTYATIYASTWSVWTTVMMTNKLKTGLSWDWILCIPLHTTT